MGKRLPLNIIRFWMESSKKLGSKHYEDKHFSYISTSEHKLMSQKKIYIVFQLKYGIYFDKWDGFEWPYTFIDNIERDRNKNIHYPCLRMK